MPTDIRITRKEGDPSNGKTNYERIKNMTDEEIEQNALDDPDAQPLSDQDIARIERLLDEKNKENKRK